MMRKATIYYIAAACATTVAFTGISAIRIGAGTDRQIATAEEWIRLLTIFSALAVGAALVNAIIAGLAYANSRRYEFAVHGLVGAPPSVITDRQLREGVRDAIAGLGFGLPVGVILARIVETTWPSQLTSVSYLSFIGIAIALAAFMARGYKKSVSLLDALAPEARNLGRYGAADLRELLNTAQLAASVALVLVSVLVWGYTGTTRAQHKELYVATGHGPFTHQLAESESIATPGALLGMGNMRYILSECMCSRGNIYTPIAPLDSQQHVVSPGFFSNVGFAMIHGRDFQAKREVVVNRAFVRVAFNTDNPVGRHVMFDNVLGTQYEVVGVVRDASEVPAVYLSTHDRNIGSYEFIVRTPRKPSLAGLSFVAFDKFATDAVANDRWFSGMLSIIGALLATIATVGAVVMMKVNINERADEIAIRRSVGATRAHIRMLLVRDIARVLFKALLWGLPLGLALSRVVTT